ncbi:MAG TPA: CAP domain-containing protein [Candidatus Binatia bacterium]|nr:CAP domain-containing protein [Candidatus Binatia bacterium]
MRRHPLLLFFFIAILALPVPAQPDPGQAMERLENELFAWVNHERGLRGLPALRSDPRLRVLARAHSRKMVQESRLDHEFPGYPKLSVRAAQAGLRFSRIGENLAVGDTAVMHHVHEQMLASPGHCDNTLDRHFTHMGIGILKKGNRYFITQEFAHLQAP